MVGGDTIQPITHCVAVLSEGVDVAATALYAGFTDKRQTLDSGLRGGVARHH